MLSPITLFNFYAYFLVVNSVRSSKTRLFGQLEHVEVSCQQFSKQCFGFILKNAVNLVSIKVIFWALNHFDWQIFAFKVLHVPKLNRSDFESWLCTNPLQKLESMIIFKVKSLKNCWAADYFHEKRNFLHCKINKIGHSLRSSSIEMSKTQTENTKI